LTTPRPRSFHSLAPSSNRNRRARSWSSSSSSSSPVVTATSGGKEAMAGAKTASTSSSSSCASPSSPTAPPWSSLGRNDAAGRLEKGAAGGPATPAANKPPPPPLALPPTWPSPRKPSNEAALAAPNQPPLTPLPPPPAPNRPPISSPNNPPPAPVPPPPVVAAKASVDSFGVSGVVGVGVGGVVYGEERDKDLIRSLAASSAARTLPRYVHTCHLYAWHAMRDTSYLVTQFHLTLHACTLEAYV